MKKYILFLLLALVTGTALAQNKITVSGTVMSLADDEPLIGATVTLKGTTTGTMTDLDGRYTLAGVPADATLIFSYVGYNPETVPVKGRTTIDVALMENTESLDELVVVGYGVVKRSDLTSSISTVKGDQITEVTTGNAMDALQGKINGVQVASGGGPGTTPKVIIRGITSVNGSNPLYVVDGVPLTGDNINFLNNNDIESMEVLKDASASAIYGTRGSNGVILITTKKGARGRTEVDFSASIGFQHLPKPSIARAHEYEQVFLARYENDGTIAPWNSPYVDYADVDGTEWWNEVFNEAALIQSYNLSVRGGSDKWLYNASIGFFRNNSQYDTGYWQKLNLRLNTEYTFNKYVRMGFDLAPQMETWTDTPDLFSAAMDMDPTTPVYVSEDQWDYSNPYNNYQRSYNNQCWNPVASVDRMKGNNSTNKLGLLMNPFVQVNPIEKVTLRTQFGVNAWFQRADKFEPEFRIDALEQSLKSKDSRNYEDHLDWSWTSTATYIDTFAEKNNLTVMVGYTMERDAKHWNNASRQDIPGLSDLLHEVSAGTGDQFAAGNSEFNTLVSFLGRVMYNYDSRYYLTASIRSDGSSRFPKGNKYATFPSASVAWRISEEKFMEPTRGWLDQFKLRLGWGKTGNQNIDNGAYITTLTADGNYVFGENPTRYPGTFIGTLGNPNLRWETVEDIDLGLDFALFNSRLDVIFDIFQKTSHDMLYKKQNPLFSGYPAWNAQMLANIGSMRAKGLELSINWRDEIQDFRYAVGVQLSSVRNKAIKFSGEGPVYDGSGMTESIIRNDEDALISRFYGYRTDGIFQNWEEVYSYVDEHGNRLQPNAVPGDFRFVDIDHDGQISTNDKVFIGNPYPDLTMGINLSAWWKGFDITANFYGTFGNDIFNLTRQRYSGAGGQNVFRGTLDKCWNIDNPTNEFPRLSNSDLNMNYTRVSDFYVEKGDYMRCKLLTIGYTLPRSILHDCSLRFYVSAQNLFTITSYTGMDPERPFHDGGAINTGIDYNRYPAPQSYIFGVDFKF